MGGDRGGRRGVSDADRRLFREAVAGARPFDGAREAPPGPAPRRPAPPGPPALSVPVARAPPAPVHGVDGRTFARLKRGRIRPEARLDLHGRTLAEAQREVGAFLARSAARGLRCVLVITGKGRVGAPGGTLRTELPRWLDAARADGRVLAAAEARQEDGGAGARYVLLRRARGAGAPTASRGPAGLSRGGRRD